MPFHEHRVTLRDIFQRRMLYYRRLVSVSCLYKELCFVKYKDAFIYDCNFILAESVNLRSNHFTIKPVLEAANEHFRLDAETYKI